MAPFWQLLLLGIAVNSYVSAHSPMENDGLFEGDIAGIDPNVLLDRNAVVDEAELWPNGIVYYEIDWKLRHIKDIIQEAIQEFESKTCLRFRPKTPLTKDYLRLTIIGGCWSSVGRKGGEQEISLSEGCHDKVSAVHEMGHAIGLWHEHSRSDRDDYLEILWDNIKEGSDQNFLKLKKWENNLLGEEFDYNSIMLYGEYAFAKDRKSMTMRPKKPGVVIGLINDKPGLSDSDVRRINRLYQCNGEVRPPPPDVPDFVCDFETDMCGLINHENSKNTQWEITRGTLGGRTGSYVAINAADASFRSIRLVTPFFASYGRKTACLKFDIYSNGNGVVALEVKMHSINTSTLVLKHTEKRDTWQKIKINLDLQGDVKFSLDARTRKSDGDGLIAIDNIRYQMHECD